jgi:hypothetical protein
VTSDPVPGRAQEKQRKHEFPLFFYGSQAAWGLLRGGRFAVQFGLAMALDQICGLFFASATYFLSARPKLSSAGAVV